MRVLVLTRNLDQSIVIGDDIVVTVLGIRGDHVRLGITARREIPIDRLEVHLSKATEKEVARLGGRNFEQ
jgi:carbon storage regulator